MLGHSDYEKPGFQLIYRDRELVHLHISKAQPRQEQEHIGPVLVSIPASMIKTNYLVQ